jgi:hypothetical protein
MTSVRAFQRFSLFSFQLPKNKILKSLKMFHYTIKVAFRMLYWMKLPIPVTSHSKAWTFFARSNARIVGSSPSRGMDICLRLTCVCVVLFVGSCLATGWCPVQGVLPNVYRIKKLKKRPMSKKRTVEPLIDGWTNGRMDWWVDRQTDGRTEIDR